MLPVIRLKKNEDRRLRAGHLWVYSNEIDVKSTPLKNLIPGQEVRIEAHDKTFLGIAYVNPHSLIAARVFSRKNDERLTLSFLMERIQSAYILRSRLYTKPYYRLIFSESDGLPGLVIDRFGETLVAQINTAGMDAQTDQIITALREVIPEIQSILLRNDSPARLQEGLDNAIVAKWGIPPEKVELEENTVKFFAPIWEGQKTGWFFDHRLNRSRLHDYVSNQRVLDVFSYLGAWGIQAAKWGAREAVCVDSSSFATSYIQSNSALNNLDDKVKILTDDAFDVLKKLNQANEKFDVIILDPPAFVKKQKDIKEGTLAYQRINELALKLLIPQGILISCSCSMHISDADFLQILRRASLGSSCHLQVLERGHQAPDHPVHIAIPETDYLKMVVGRKI